MGVVDFYEKLYLPWMESSTFCTVKFENLIGSKGGGSTEAQINEMLKICSHLDIEISLKNFIEILNNYWGKTSTFRSGKIDEWKEYFTPEIKKIFKAMPGANELLIKLGYEENCDW